MVSSKLIDELPENCSHIFLKKKKENRRYIDMYICINILWHFFLEINQIKNIQNFNSNRCYGFWFYAENGPKTHSNTTYIFWILELRAKQNSTPDSVTSNDLKEFSSQKLIIIYVFSDKDKGYYILVLLQISKWCLVNFKQTNFITLLFVL